MFHEITLRVTRYFVVSLMVGIVAQAQPATANFVILNNDHPHIYDGRMIAGNLVNTRYELINAGTCFYYRDQRGDNWALVTPVHYFRTDASGTTVPIVFGTLRNTRTNEVWDGGYAIASNYGYFANLIVWPSCY